MLEQNCLLLSDSVKQKINDLRERLGLLTASPALKHPLERIEELYQDIDNLSRSAFLAVQHLIQIAEERITAVLGKFQALNPLSILGRGFSLTATLDNKIIKQAKWLKIGQRVNTMLAKGSFESEVKKIVDSM
jgi:exodeoxyribonuclease VII large subunit